MDYVGLDLTAIGPISGHHIEFAGFPRRESFHRSLYWISTALNLGDPKRRIPITFLSYREIIEARLVTSADRWLAQRPVSGNPERWVSHETIYRSLFIQARGALKKQLIGHLRSRRRIRRSHSAIDGRNSERIVGAVSIRERPAEVEDRAVPGHWEGDLVEGSRGTFIATLVERQSRFVVLVKLPDKRTDVVIEALIKAVRKLPTVLRKSLTWDRGSELTQHAKFTVATDVKVYFCDPYSPWQRGSNENTNGLLRQYYPKGKDLSTISQAQLDTVATKLNTRPRETLNWKTPAYILESSVSMTH